MKHNIPRVRVAYLCTAMHGLGGTVRHIGNWLNALDLERYEPILIYYSKQREDIESYYRQHLKRTVEIIYLPRERFLFPLFTILRLVHILRSKRICIVHSLFLQSDAIASISGFLAGVKRHVSSIEGKIIPSNASGIKQRIYAAANRIFRRTIQMNFVISRGLYQYLLNKQQIAAERSVVINNGIETDRVRSVTVHQYDSSFPKLGILSRLSREKGVKAALSALPVIIERFPSVELFIAGDGPEKLEIEEIIEKQSLGRTVRLLGWQDPEVFFSKIDLLVIPSFEEGLPFVLLEAMMAGCGVVASDVGGVPDVLKDSVNGWLVPPRSPDAIARTVISVLEDPDSLQRVRGEAKRTILEHFTVQREIADIQAHYEGLMGAAL